MQDRRGGLLHWYTDLVSCWVVVGGDGGGSGVVADVG
jgi:hypothetical protein